jgi:hypothetical protein
MVPLDPDNFVYFLDCDAIPSDDFLGMAKEVLEAGIPFAMGDVFWVRDGAGFPARKTVGVSRAKRVKRVWSATRHYLWTVIVRGDMIREIRFNERIGPGETTVLKAGEDMLYFYEIVKQNRISEFVVYPHGLVYHPERPADLSKELLYARGQGALYRYLLTELDLPWGGRLNVLLMFTLFIGNALYRTAIFRHNGFRVLKERLRGTLSGALQGYLKPTSDEVTR